MDHGGTIFMQCLAITWPIRLEYFSGWTALGLWVVLSVPFVLLGVRSLAGLGPVRKWVAIAMRLIVIAALVLILGGVRWQRQHKNLEVMVLKDISQSTLNVRDYPGREEGHTLQFVLENYLNEASVNPAKPRNDRIGVISFHSDAQIDAMPHERLMLESRTQRDPGNGTDVASAIQLGLVSLSRDAMHRLLLIWDGNMTSGDLERALSAAASAGVPIDVMPLRYDIRNEVMVDRFIAPTWKREQEDFHLEIVLRSTNTVPVEGELTVYHQNVPMDLDPATPGVQSTRKITLRPGIHVERVPVPGQAEAGVHQFRAEFRAPNVEILQSSGASTAAVGDTLLQNNSATAFTFVRGRGKVLYIDNSIDNQGHLLAEALQREGVTLDQERRSIDQFPNDLVTLQNYDAVILVNVPRGAGGLSERQQELLTSYVHDMGGGLLMIGGPNAFGAGGWQGSKLEEILPVDMDIPAQRQIAKGALVLIMHSCEMPNGNYWGEQCAIKAVEALSNRDEIGVLSYDWGRAGPGGTQWDFPLQEKGDGSKVIAAIKNMQLGDMQDFGEAMNIALNGQNGQGGLIHSNARQKHVIIISDGDPSPPPQSLIDQYVQAKVTVSTVSVYPHGNFVPPAMQNIAEATGGKYYGPINANFNQLPQIFIKEATVVRRSLIHEPGPGEPLLQPLFTPTDSDMVAGIDAVPGLRGMVLTSRKASPEIKVPLVVGANKDPLLAHWQTGLGRAAVFTSDAHARWAAPWVGSDLYGKFWAQVVRSLARPPMSSDFDVQTVQEADKARITVEALGQDAGHLNFLSIRGQVVGPDMQPRDVRLVQTGPGMYEAQFDTPEPGNYVVVLRYQGLGGENGMLLSGVAVNTSPELRDLRSQDAMMELVARRTGGRILEPWTASAMDLFSRENVRQTASPMPVWDRLLPIALALFLLDVATRRIAWDWASLKRAYATATGRIREFTTTRKVETRQSLDALKKVRSETAAEITKPPQAPARPDPSARFEASSTAVEGDISRIVGGAENKPVPRAPKQTEPPKGLQGERDTLGGLMAAKRRAQQRMKDGEKPKDPS